jgi:hypothetical protein
MFADFTLIGYSFMAKNKKRILVIAAMLFEMNGISFAQGARIIQRFYTRINDCPECRIPKDIT